MVGVLDDFDNRMTLSYKTEGDIILLIGKQQNCINSSEYLHKLKQVEFSPAPAFDLEEEFAVQQFVALLIKDRIIESAHDVSEGGLIVTLLEKGFNNNLGFEVVAPSASERAGVRLDAYWFGEAQSRVVVTVNPSKLYNLQSLLAANGISNTQLGTVTNGSVQVNGENWGNMHVWKEKYDTAIETFLQ
jgi:phosphoribosylformylglycinamidine synthase